MNEISSEFEDALRVLAITVIVDQRIRDTELSEFCEQAIGLAPLTGIDTFDESRALAWYEGNQGSIREDLQGRSKNTVILRSITRVKSEVMREALYDAILAVSISDQEYHRKESDLVRSAAAIWGFVRPPFKVADTED